MIDIFVYDWLQYWFFGIVTDDQSDGSSLEADFHVVCPVDH